MATNIKQIFANEYIKLVNEKGLSKVSIIDLTEHCNSSRQSFYYHFKNLDDLIRYSMISDTQELCDSIDGKEMWVIPSKKYADILRRHEGILKGAINSKRNSVIMNILHESIDIYVRAFILKRNNGKKQFSEFVYTSAMFVFTGFVIRELEKDKPDFDGMIDYINDNLYRKDNFKQ